MTTAFDPKMNRTAVANRIRPFQESLWLEIDDVLAKYPNVVYFGNGAPGKSLMPADRLAEATAAAWQEGNAMLSYGETEGYKPLRELISRRMSQIKATVDPDEILIINGSQEGMDIVGRTLIDPGDYVLVDAPVFPDAIRLYESHGATVIGMPIDAEGVIVDEVRSILDGLPAKPKFIYTIPTFQNPSGVTMTLERRQDLVNLARERDILLVEDDPYSAYRYEGETLPALRGLDPSVVYLGTFSKTIAPALRVGWICAPYPLYDQFFAVKEVMSIGNDRVMPRVVYHAAEGFLDKHIAWAREQYRLRRDTLIAGLSAHLPAEATWVTPQGGFFVWVELPETIDTDSLLEVAASEHGVVFLPGSWFYPGRTKHNFFRLSFSALEPEELAEGARRIGETLKATM